ncbi:MAG TPA: hypothetical protein VFB66_04450 [Tepidisphaeraceae bacterium]|nr:hypothetical protein [Tepidisphaeraceae bacterium]
MRRLCRAILALCTAVAAFGATSLQGKVLCYSHCGRHVAVEAPHADGCCPAGHEGHDHSDEGHDADSESCTDVSAAFPVTRDAAHAADLHPADLAFAAALWSSIPFAATQWDPTASVADTHPPAPPDLARLRTIVLLV